MDYLRVHGFGSTVIQTLGRGARRRPYSGLFIGG